MLTDNGVCKHDKMVEHVNTVSFLHYHLSKGRGKFFFHFDDTGRTRNSLDVHFKALRKDVCLLICKVFGRFCSQQHMETFKGRAVLQKKIEGHKKTISSSEAKAERMKTTIADMAMDDCVKKATIAGLERQLSTMQIQVNDLAEKLAKKNNSSTAAGIKIGGDFKGDISGAHCTPSKKGKNDDDSD